MGASSCYEKPPKFINIQRRIIYLLRPKNKELYDYIFEVPLWRDLTTALPLILNYNRPLTNLTAIVIYPQM